MKHCGLKWAAMIQWSQIQILASASAKIQTCQQKAQIYQIVGLWEKWRNLWQELKLASESRGTSPSSCWITQAGQRPVSTRAEPGAQEHLILLECCRTGCTTRSFFTPGTVQSSAHGQRTAPAAAGWARRTRPAHWCLRTRGCSSADLHSSAENWWSARTLHSICINRVNNKPGTI